MQVLETTHQVGRLSVSAATNMPYMEMAGQREATEMGKQQKLSMFIVSQQRQESLIRFSNDCSQEKETPSVVPLGASTVFSLACILHGKVLNSILLLLQFALHAYCVFSIF